MGTTLDRVPEVIIVLHIFKPSKCEITVLYVTNLVNSDPNYFFHCRVT